MKTFNHKRRSFDTLRSSVCGLVSHFNFCIYIINYDCLSSVFALIYLVTKSGHIWLKCNLYFKKKQQIIGSFEYIQKKTILHTQKLLEFLLKTAKKCISKYSITVTGINVFILIQTYKVKHHKDENKNIQNFFLMQSFQTLDTFKGVLTDTQLRQFAEQRKKRAVLPKIISCL